MSGKRNANESASPPVKRAPWALGPWVVVLATLTAWAAATEARAEALNIVSQVAVKKTPALTTVTIVGSSEPRYSVVRNNRPPQLRVDLSGARVRGVPSLIGGDPAAARAWPAGDPAAARAWPAGDPSAVGQVLVSEFGGGRSSIVRVTIALAERAQYSVRREGHNIVVSLMAPLSGKTEVDARATDRSRPRPVATVMDVAFADFASRSEVVVELDRMTRYELKSEQGQPVLELAGAELPARLRRKLDTSEYHGPVSAVVSHSCGARPGGGTCLRLMLASEVPHRVRRRGTKLVWEVIKSATTAEVGGARQADGFQPRTYSFKPTRVAASNTGLRPRADRHYAGRRIDLDFKDADIHNILRLLSDVGNVNIITSDAVSGRVTIRMKDVPWDQALDVILRAKGLGQVREGNLIRVAPLADLEKEREAEIARQKQIMLLQTLETRLIPLSYAQAGEVLPKLQYTLSPRGKVTFDERTNMVIARDVPSNLDLLERMIRNLDTQTPQVMIESRIVEARTNYTRQVGVQWGGAFSASSATGNSTGLAFPNQVGIGGGTDDPQAPVDGILLGQAANPNFAVNMPAPTGLNSGGALGLTLGSVSGVFNLNLRLSAAESTGDIRIISAPKVTTLDNVEAKIEQGVSIPFSQVSANGVQTQFRDAKLSLLVKPHVTADGSIVMKIKVERNEPDFVNTGARGDPTILKKEAQTEMLVKDGDTAVIGGIYTTRDGQSWQKVPWFAEIPILGWLFKTRRDTSDREEVLVFITPRIINRAQSLGQ